MPDVAVSISKSITRVSDFISKVLDDHYDVLDEKNKYRLVTESLPKKLVEVAGPQLLHDLPQPYVKAMIASSLASKMVYAEGINYVDSLSESSLTDACVSYLRQKD